jgi:F-type H+-transporting ATPase subunit b
MKLNRLLSTIILGAALAAAPLAAQHAPEAQAPAPAAQGHEAPKTEGHEAPKTEGHEAPKAEGHEAAGGHAAAPHGEGAHHGPAIKLFGMELGPGAQNLVKVINFAIFAGGLFLLLKGALSAAFRARTKDVEERLAQAEKDKAEGEAQMKQLAERMEGLQAELDSILAKADADAAAEKARIIEGARAEAATILAQAQADIASHQRSAEAELRALVAELAVEGATKRLQAQLQGATASNAIDRAIQQVGTSSGGLQ